MKKNLLILSALTGVAFLIMYILVRGAEPDRIFTSFNRDYSRFSTQVTDTLLFPGRVSVMEVSPVYIYGYVYGRNTVYRAAVTGGVDTFFHATGMITRMDADSSGFYMLDATGNKLYKYTGTLDSSGAQFPVLLSKGYDSVQQHAYLRLWGTDMLLHAFPHFEDGGLSADGFFVKRDVHHFYIPFYNSGIIRYDETTGMMFTINTIDSTPAANIAVPAGKIYMLSSKAVIVNSTATADEKYLYVLSYIVSADAVKDGYEGPSVDVYDYMSGQYKGSIRLPGFQGKAVLQLGKFRDTLVAAYENNILLFKLNEL
jgi:hypothetical protein